MFNNELLLYYFLRKTKTLTWKIIFVFKIKVVNSVLVSVLFFQLKWNVSVLKCFGMPFWGCTVYIYIYIYIYI